MVLKLLRRISRIRHVLTHRRGFCTICSRHTLFLLTESPTAVRNHAWCVRCRSSSRQRHVALCVLETFRDRGIGRCTDFREHPELSVYDTSTSSWMARCLAGAPNFTASEYFDDVPRGEQKNGLLCQDLQRLTFANDSFDLMISEDVFEHVPDYREAFREVFRVLKPGGAHIFSIPFYFDRRTRDLFEWKAGVPALFEPMEYHGDPIRGEIPCYVHFGYDLLDFLRETGFEARVKLSSFAEAGCFGTFDSYTLICRKLT